MSVQFEKKLQGMVSICNYCNIQNISITFTTNLNNFLKCGNLHFIIVNHDKVSIHC
jgi:hypothetical protein